MQCILDIDGVLRLIRRDDHIDINCIVKNILGIVGRGLIAASNQKNQYSHYSCKCTSFHKTLFHSLSS